MAEALLIPAAKGILEGLLSLAKDPVTGQIKQAWGFEQDLKKLCRRLETIQGLLEAAENQNVTSKPMLAAWLKHLKAATCDAENVLDELAYEDLRRKFEKKLCRDPYIQISFSIIYICVLVYWRFGDDEIFFFKQEMELSLVGLQSAGRTSLMGGYSEDMIPTVCRYVVDAADRDSVPISQSELHELLMKPSSSGIHLLVLSNKIDKSEAISKQALMDQLIGEVMNQSAREKYAAT
ncbi:hypothetical protein Vadar_011228 [Vaccinium darrowii]|uniref:Uncharacterized protein n=1 Tax=Vaccinium darrowii TaxID=229202 RepID=A0ACB7Z3I4_9ERIC|nr:hypothetical protein Vadar_011228 [Vaccinium darrowii]